MRSFGISLIVTLALGAVSWAAPAAAVRDVNPIPQHIRRDDLVNLDADISAGVLRRDEGIVDVELDVGANIDLRGQDTIESILTCLIKDLEPVIDSLKSITSDKCTHDFLSPIVDQIVKLIDDAVAALNAIASDPIDVLLGSLLDAGGLAKLLCELLELIFAALGAVLSLVASDNLSDVTTLLGCVATAVASLLSCIFGIVGPLLGDVVGILVGLIADIVPVIVDLRIAALLDILNL